MPDRIDSIKVTKTSTGKHSFEIKIYHSNLLDEANQDETISKIKKIENKLKQIFEE